MIARKLCPDCGGDLGKSATKCRCGWKAQSDGVTTSAYAAARYEEFKRKETDREQRQHDEAQTFMRQHGLKNVADCVNFGRRTLKGIEYVRADPATHWRKVLANPKACYAAQEMAKKALAKIEGRSLQREPGQDDEEVPG